MVSYILGGLLLFTLVTVYRREGKAGLRSGLLGIIRTITFVIPFIFLGVI